MLASLMGLKSISCRDASALLLDRRAAVFDVNASSRWAVARVPGARNLDPVTFGEADLPTGKHAEVIFYCSNMLCRKAPTAARRAKAMGYTNVRVMSAGIQGWISERLPVEGAGT